jgi:hypothetical protein
LYGRVIQVMICRGCPLKNTYPVCTACDIKAEIDRVDTVTTRAFNKNLFSRTPLLSMMQHRSNRHPSRWREDHYERKKGKTIRVPLVYG